ncbi:DUF3592 domain-containing protein [Reinekea marinisedimentorum]|uniref:Uncharacterized protein DUF3592 n=1 Tax=Reinekea marinisedimentorum TaxID=230495 RepID=A0A4R3HTW1_9GAMM|nr:uncharacterized protein DUF3592 [Reinekea marinisedimentorum]
MDSGLQLKLLMLGLWLIMVYRSYGNIVRSLSSKEWPSTTAKVVLSSFDRTQSLYEPKIIYRYSINGMQYDNDTYTHLGAFSTTKKTAIKISKNHPEGSNITIHVNPRAPQQSVIVPGIHWVQVASFVALTLMLLGIAYIGEILNFIYPGCQPKCT